MDNILAGNPLLNVSETASSSSNGGEFKVKRRWDDDVVFKNCAKGNSASFFLFCLSSYVVRYIVMLEIIMSIREQMPL